ncbi:MAG: DUF3467 domain-containing protein [Candidatus Nanoarchaeia archaeon]
MKEEKQINIRVKEGDPFLAHETTINYNPTEFVLDFKCMTPLQELNQQSLLIKHNIVLLTPWHARSFLDALTRVIGDYESKFGTIKKPIELEKAEKLVKKQQQKTTVTSRQAENYFG